MNSQSRKHSTSKNFPKKKRQKTHLSDLSNSPIKCRCGGGQSCIVDRRNVGDWVHEDDVFKNAGLPLRKHCMQPYYETQKKALKDSMNFIIDDE